MATTQANATPRSPARVKIDALLAARQPKIAVIVMVDVLSTAITRFATSTGMIISPGNVYEKTVSMLDRASKACGNPSFAARLEHCAHLVNVARASVTTKITMEGAELLDKAVIATLPVLESPGLTKLVKLNAAMHAARTGESLLALPGSVISPRKAESSKARLIDPVFAGAFFCGMTGAWSILGSLASLSIKVGLEGLAWLFMAFVLFKMRGVGRVKIGIAKWNDPRIIVRKTAAIAICTALTLFLPLVTSTWRSINSGSLVQFDTTASLFTLLTDSSVDSWLFLVKGCTICFMILSIVLDVLAARCHDDSGNASKKVHDYNTARALLLCITVIAWVAIIAWQHGQGSWFPYSIWSDGFITITTSIGLAWYTIGMLGLLAA